MLTLVYRTALMSPTHVCVNTRTLSQDIQKLHGYSRRIWQKVKCVSTPNREPKWTPLDHCTETALCGIQTLISKPIPVCVWVCVTIMELKSQCCYLLSDNHQRPVGKKKTLLSLRWKCFFLMHVKINRWSQLISSDGTDSNTECFLCCIIILFSVWFMCRHFGYNGFNQ